MSLFPIAYNITLESTNKMAKVNNKMNRPIKIKMKVRINEKKSNDIFEVLHIL